MATFDDHKSLKPYRVYLLEVAPGELAVLTFESRSDADAFRTAKEQAANRPFQMWNGDRLVIERYPPE